MLFVEYANLFLFRNTLFVMKTLNDDKRVLSVYALCCKDKNIYVNNCVSQINDPHLVASVAVFAVKKCYIFSCSDIFS